MTKYFIQVSINGCFSLEGGTYEITEKFHTEIVGGIKDQLDRGKAREI
jgi:hypothetical protein